MDTLPKKSGVFNAARLWDLVKLVPLFAVLAYVAGYIVDLSYLDSLGFHYLRLVNSTFFRSGVLTLILFAPIIYSVYSHYANPTDNAAVSAKQVPYIVNTSATMSLIIAYYVTLGTSKELGAFILQRPYSLVLLLLMVVDFFIWFHATSYAGKSMSQRRRALLFIIPAAIQYAFALFIGPPSTRVLLLLFGATSLLTFIFLGIYADKKLTAVAPIVAVIYFFVGCSFFGRYVYANIPQYLGGMRPYEAALTVRPQFADSISSIGFSITDSVQLRNATILYQDADIYILQENSECFSVEKDAFVAMSKSK